jgi:hypothetical protein
LESLGILDRLDETGRSPGALGAINDARRLGGVGSIDSIRLAATHVRILLKLRRFDAAEAVADSTLTDHPTPTAVEANALAPLAALTGRARLTARLLSTAAIDITNELFSDPQGGGRVLPASVLSAAGTFAGYAALAAPSDSLRVARSRTERMIRSWIAAPNRESVRASVFLPADFQAQPALGASLMGTLRVPRARLLPPWQAIARTDTSGARRLAARDGPRLTSNDVVPAPDVSLQYELLALAVGDTVTAMAALDRVAVSLPELGSRLTTEVFPAAALPRVLALRARLAHVTATEPGTLWSSARVLWLHADPELRDAADSSAARKPAARK